MVAEFSGNFSHNIDPKGRATIPSIYRRDLGDQFTLGMNQQLNALALYPKEEWAQISAQLNRIPVSDAKGMAYVRMIKAFSYPAQSLDGQGRLLLPAVLREKAGMDKAITFVGMGRFLEIWDADRFAAFCSASETSFEQLMDYVNDRYFGADHS
ncbi:MAG: division/cell wall cluster transcriptional repressor MraZ [Clostridia bacterium]|nr:division/cell wall cluster transcriptional repressor MraZ [Clostridia bacterium]MBQ8972323.1 division/cell wall cluster transcriptional repressor MraZ [Clostridia bacterium]